MNNLNLLRQYEPIMRFTRGELFFPCAVDEYLRLCSLWKRDTAGNETRIADVGTLSAEKLASYESIDPHHIYYLRFVQKPLEPNEYRLWSQDPTHHAFRAGGRLTRVNLASRLIDTLLDVSLLIRGAVPRGTAAAASLLYRDIRQIDDRYVYYGRVVREGGYIVLHYLFFYVMNNWRSGFYGVNDHEADWEQIFVYLSDEADKPPIPRWAAYASHDFKGDDLRRRWDDPELEKIGTHPIIYAGAGSHASYFQAGEYLMNVEPAFIRPLTNLIHGLRSFWTNQLGQGETQVIENSLNQLRVPFIDYARGDGLEIGVNCAHTWSPILLTDDTHWAHNYRGLWGLDTQDFVGGERAPGGAKFNRNGSVRQAWADPLGWSGLDKVTPPRELAAQIERMLGEIARELAEIVQTIGAERRILRDLAVEVESLAQTEPQSSLCQERETALTAQQTMLRNLHQRQANLQTKQRALSSRLRQIKAGTPTDPRAHIVHTHPPEPPLPPQRRLVEIWATLSSAILIIVLIAFLLSPTLRQFWLYSIGLTIGMFTVLEAIIRQRLLRLLLNITITLAMVGALILIYEFWLVILVAALIGFVGLLLREKLREIAHL